jgi:hypothetical protein
MSIAYFAARSPQACQFSSRPNSELVINLNTAKALDLTVPAMCLRRTREEGDFANG